MGETSRETLTILFTDVEGSTAFRTRVGDAAANRVLQAHDRAVAELVGRYQGRQVKSLGDGCLVVFASSRRAVECAVAVQRAAKSSPLRVRIGINAGEVDRVGDDVLGTAVHAAARIAAKAQGGEILISEVVRQLLGTTALFSLQSRGRFRLRGFPERWRLHEVVWSDDPVTAQGPTRRSVLVGRTAELARIGRTLDNLTAGRGAVVVVRGEAGIGKTRLATEALHLGAARGWRVMTGRAAQLEGGLGLGPVVEAFGPVLRNMDRQSLSVLVGELPHLTHLFEGLGTPPPSPLSDPGLERTLLFESMVRLVERLAADTPVLLLIDDLHWADSATLEFVQHLAGAIEEHAVALVLTCRPSGGDDRWRRLLSSLRRSPIIEEVELARLDAEAVVTLAQGWLGGRLPSGLAGELHRAGGTPLFVEGFLRVLVDGGRLVPLDDGWVLSDGDVRVPDAIRDVILERIGALSATARKVLDIMALTAGSVAHDVVADASGLAALDLDDALEELETAGIVEETEDQASVLYRLEHPLYHEVAAAEMPPIIRRRAHATVAAAVERCRPDDLDELARHYLEAGPAVETSRALDVFAEAAGRAMRRRAYAAATRLLEAAVGRARAGDPGRLAGFLEQLGQASHGAGRTDLAVRSLTEALEERRRSGDLTATARVEQALGLAEFDRGALAEARAHLDGAAAIFAGVAPTGELADVHMARLTVARRLGGHAELAAIADQLDHVADILGTARARAQAAYGRVASLLSEGRLTEALQLSQTGLCWASEAADDALAYRLHTVCCEASLLIGDHQEVLRHSADCYQLGVGIIAGGGALFRAFGAVHAGTWQDAIAYSDEDLDAARRFNNVRLLVSVLGFRAWLVSLLGDVRAAEKLLAEGQQLFTPSMEADRRGFATLRWAEVRLALELDDPERALAACRVLGDYQPALDTYLGCPVAEALVRGGDLDAARRATEALSRMASPLTTAMAAWVDGLIAAAAGILDEAQALLSQSAAGFDALATPFFSARSRLDRARILADIDPAAALTDAGASLTVFDQIGAVLYADRVRGLLSASGVSEGALRGAGARSGPLSRRELEVAHLVAEGLSNREIAERLTLSIRTVTSHLDHIYTRLGIRTRAALARHILTEHLETEDGR